MESRTEAKDSELLGGEAADLSRFHLGRLAKARNERLKLVECVGQEERFDQPL